jgi:ankyrin repeat protein
MRHRTRINIDPIFTPAFFQYRNEQTLDIAPPFPLPPSAHKLEKFLVGPQGTRLREVCTLAIHELSQWAVEHHLNPGPLDKFQNSFIDYSGKNAEENQRRMPLYTEGFPALVRIVELVQTPAIEINTRIDIIKNLLTSIAECAPGTHTNIINAYLDLMAQLNLPSQFMRLRKRIAEQTLEEIIAYYHIPALVEIHYVNAILNRYADDIHIPPIKDAYENCCAPDALKQIDRFFTARIPLKMTPDSIIEQLASNLGYENIANAVNDNLAAANGLFSALETKLNAYGTENDAPIYYRNDILDSSDDYLTHTLSWRAKYIIYLSLLRRLQASGYVSAENNIIMIGKTKLHSMLPHPLALSFVTLPNLPEELKPNRPFLTHCVEELAKDNRAMRRFVLHSKHLTPAHRLEIAAAIGEYLATLNDADYQQAVSGGLTKTITALLPFEIVINTPVNKFFKIYMQNIDEKMFEKHFTPNDKITLKKILPELLPANASRLLLHLCKNNKRDNIQFVLRLAARHGNLEVIRVLLQKLTYTITPGNFGDQSLFTAIKYGHTDIARALIEAKITSVYCHNKKGRSPLAIAAEHGHIDLVATLLELNANPDTLVEDNLSLLYQSINNGHFDIAELLLAYGANIQPDISRRDNPLIAATLQGHTGIVNAILALGGNVNARTPPGGYTALHTAAKHNQVEVAELLLSNGADVDAISQTLSTPLYVAVINNHVQMVNLLLNHHADPKIFEHHPLHQAAADRGYHDIARLLQIHELEVTLQVAEHSPRHQAFKKLKLAVAHHPENFPRLYHVFQALHALEIICQDVKPKNTRESLVLHQLADSLDEVYATYLTDDAEPHEEIICNLQEMLEHLTRELSTRPKLQSVLGLFGIRNRFVTTIQDAAQPLSRP